MPKGVEHWLLAHRATYSRYWEVRIPLMPKGVEHTLALQSRAIPSTRVRIPLMPKGVEHILQRTWYGHLLGACEYL